MANNLNINNSTVTLNIAVDAAQALRELALLQAEFRRLSTTSQQPIFGSLNGQLLGLTGAVVAFGAVFRKSLNINSELENATLGVKTLLVALTDIRDQSGKKAVGAEQLAIAGSVAEDQIKKLRVAGLETAATTQQLVEAFQQAIGAGSSAGLKLDQIRELTVGIVQAAGALGMPMHQLNEEVRSIFSGTITMNSRVANALGITGAQVKKWRETGTLAEELNKRLEAFTRMGKEAANTWTATLSNLGEALAIFLGDAGKGAFDSLKKSLQDAFKGLFDSSTGDISKDFEGIAAVIGQVFSGIGTELATGIDGAVTLAKDLSTWFEKNRDTVGDIGHAMGVVWDNVKGVVGSVAEVIGGVIKWAAESGAITAFFQGVAVLVAMVQDGFKLWGGALAGVGATVVDKIGGPLRQVLLSLSGFLAEIPGIGTKLASVVVQLATKIPNNSDGLRAYAAKVKADFEGGRTAVAATLKALATPPKKTETKTDPKPKATGTAAPIKRSGEDDGKKAERAASAMRAAQEALAKAQAEATKKIAEAARQTDEAELELSLERRLLTYRDYLNKRAKFERDAVAAETQAQKDALAQAENNAAAEKDPAKKKRYEADAVKIRAEIKALESKGATIDASLKLKVEQFQKQVDSLRVDIKANIIELGGETLQASLMRLKKETEDMLRDTRVSGDPELEDLVRRQASLKENRLYYDEATKQANIYTEALSIGESRIQQQVTNGTLSEMAGQQKIRQARLAAAAAMQAQIAAAGELAAKSGDPQAILAVEQLKLKYEELAGTTDAVAKSVNDTFFGSLKQGFQDLISGAKSFQEVMLSIISSVLSKIADMALDQALTSLLKSTGGGGGGLGSLVSKGLSWLGIGGYATGGLIDGPGTGTSDSILARVSTGEYVFRAASVRALGVDKLNYINRTGRLPAFATGGLVGSLGGMRGEASTVHNAVNVTPKVFVTSEAIREAMRNDPGFERDIVDIAARNGKRIQSKW